MQLKHELRILLNVAGTQFLLDNWSVWKERITKYAELESANRKTVTDFHLRLVISIKHSSNDVMYMFLGDFVATMSKRHILMDHTQSSTTKRSKPPSSTNWDICILCQVTTGKPLQCPLRSTKQSIGSGYVSLT